MRGTWWVRPDQLDDEQRAAIALPNDESFIVIGPPGSGKTNLLLLRATNLIRSGTPNVQVLVFNRTLEEFVAHCPGPYAIQRDKLSTIIRWEMRLINQFGGTPSRSSSITKAREENCQLLMSLLDKEGIDVVHDHIVLDEGQDYTIDEVALLRRASRHLFVVADSRQAIYDHDDPLPAFATHCKLHPLSHHYRNGAKICSLADALGSHWSDYTPLARSSQYKERDLPSSLNVHSCASIADQVARALKAIGLQLRAYPDEMLGVVCPRRAECDEVRRILSETPLNETTVYQSSDVGYLPFQPTTQLCVCTAHGAKGVEFRAMHLIGAEHFGAFRRLQRKLAYTAITRAKTSLDIYHTAHLPAYLEGAVAVAMEKKRETTIEELFKT